MSTTDNAIQYHGGLQTRKLGQAPILLFLTIGRYHLIIVNRWSDSVGYRIEIVYIYNILSTILQHFTLFASNTMKSSFPLLLADGTLCCKMYPTGKVAISQHLVTPGFLQCDHTIGKLIADAGIY